MYIWNAEQLAADLRDGKVTQRSQLHYFLALTAIQSLVGRASIIWSLRQPSAAIWPFLMFVVSAVGLVLCFRVNSRGDDRDFAARIICLGLPASIRTYSLYAVLAAILLVITGIKPPWHEPESWAAWIVWGPLAILAMVGYFAQLVRYLGLAAGPPQVVRTA
jgi:hypothetical protein